MSAAAYVLQKNAHVRIDVISSRLSKRTRDWIDLFGHIFMLAPICIIMVWLSGPFFMEAYVNTRPPAMPGACRSGPSSSLCWSVLCCLRRRWCPK